ncbi:semaphorin-4A [Coturnix japonica]|uniref:semaphorin-4A n=1 Tax=Coturnix japonica TaxID=93934 RepID=UPI00077789F8|nr:semaphorin-4A [Coturnix japonica]
MGDSPITNLRSRASPCGDERHTTAARSLWGRTNPAQQSPYGPDPPTGGPIPAPQKPRRPQPGDPRRPVRSFSSPRVRDCDSLLLGPDESLLYVGARDAVLALNVSDPNEPRLVATVPWGPTEEKKRECSLKRKSPETECFNFIRVLVALNRSHLYACGTNAFSPACTHILLENFTLPRAAVGQRDGKGQSPFDPRHSHTALLDGGELYAATANNFHGTEPVISRSLGARTALKTDAFLRWLCSAGSSSDQLLSFMKDHFLMESRVVPTHGRPLLLSAASYTHIAVHQTRGAAGTEHRVLLMATDTGFLHKAVEVGEGRAHIVESVQMFEEPQRVSSVLLSASKDVLYVGHAGGVLVLPLSNCSQHRSCTECVLARDPHCGWSSSRSNCERVGAAPGDGPWLQDVERGDAGSCYRGRSRGAETGPEELTLTPPVHSLLRLPCPPRSAWASYSWEQPVGARGVTEQLPDLTLLVAAQPRTAGTYTCWATENGARWAVVRYRLQEPHEAPERGGCGMLDGAATSGSYRARFVAVTALLALTLVAAAGLGLVAYRARSKVRGCPGGGGEKKPLNGGGERGCCLQMDGNGRERGDGGER